MPCMSGSSKRTNPIPSDCQPPRISLTSLMDPAPSVLPRPAACWVYLDGPLVRNGALPYATRRRDMRAVAVRVEEGRMAEASIQSDRTHVLPLELGRAMPVIVRGEGVWVEDAGGRRYLDAMSGGSMAATLGHGRRDIIEAARRQAQRLAYVHNERLTNPLQERLAAEICDVAPPGFTRVRFVTGGAEANETAIRLARAYHVERGEPSRWQV